MDDKSFNSSIVKSNVPNLPIGSNVKIQTLPFIKVYEDLSVQYDVTEFHNKMQKIKMPMELIHDYTDSDIVTAITNVDRIKLHHADKYIFTSSAMKMHETIFHIPTIQWLPIATHTWIELETPVNTSYGESVKAVYVNKAYPIPEIDRVVPVSKDKFLNTSLHKTMSIHKYHWSLDIITLRCQLMFDFTYNIQTNQWIYLASHICPYGKCDYPIPTDIDSKHAGLCIPCEKCKQACIYWSSWLYYAIDMIQGTYAIEPAKPTFDIERMEYTQEEKIHVGKGKNKRSLKRDVTRGIDYTIVKYDISTKKHHEIPEITEEIGKRANWLVLTDNANIIWEHVMIKKYDRRYPIKRDGTRKDGNISIKNDFKKWVPMLKERKTIKKVVASQYEDKKK